MTPREWMDATLAKKRWSYNELSRRANVSSSSVTRFVKGEAGADLCFRFAIALGLPVEEVLIASGNYALPPVRNEQRDRWVAILRSLDDENRQKVLEYAELMLASADSHSLESFRGSS